MENNSVDIGYMLENSSLVEKNIQQLAKFRQEVDKVKVNIISITGNLAVYGVILKESAGAINLLTSIISNSTKFLLGHKLAVSNATMSQSLFNKAINVSKFSFSEYQRQIILARSAIASTTGATKAMNIAIASSPYLLVAAAVATLGVGIYNLAVNNSEAAKAQKRLDEAMLGMNKEISSEQLSLDTLFNSLYKAKEGSEGFLLCLYCIVSFSSVLFALFSLSCFFISSRSSFNSSPISFLFSSS